MIYILRQCNYSVMNQVDYSILNNIKARNCGLLKPNDR